MRATRERERERETRKAKVRFDYPGSRVEEIRVTILINTFLFEDERGRRFSDTYGKLIYSRKRKSKTAVAYILDKTP